MSSPQKTTKNKILRSALRIFAHRGYAGASIQDIVDDAKVTKPTLYYYFKNKAGLYKALVDHSMDERYRLLMESAQHATSFESRLEEMLTSLFEFAKQNKDLVRLSFSTAFASPGEIPPEVKYIEKAWRIYHVIEGLMACELKAKRLKSCFKAPELAIMFHGLINVHVMSHVVSPEFKLSRSVARQVVKLFLSGSMST